MANNLNQMLTCVHLNESIRLELIKVNKAEKQLYLIYIYSIIGVFIDGFKG